MPRTVSCVDLALNLAEQGKRVLWIDYGVEIAETVRSLDRTDERFKKVCVANGRECVLMRGGGEVQFVATAGGGWRGFEADALFVDAETYRNKGRFADILPALAASEFTRVGGEPFVTVLPERPRINA